MAENFRSVVLAILSWIAFSILAYVSLSFAPRNDRHRGRVTCWRWKWTVWCVSDSTSTRRCSSQKTEEEVEYGRPKSRRHRRRRGGPWPRVVVVRCDSLTRPTLSCFASRDSSRFALTAFVYSSHHRPRRFRRRLSSLPMLTLKITTRPLSQQSDSSLCRLVGRGSITRSSDSLPPDSIRFFSPSWRLRESSHSSALIGVFVSMEARSGWSRTPSAVLVPCPRPYHTGFANSCCCWPRLLSSRFLLISSSLHPQMPTILNHCIVEELFAHDS